MYRCRTSRNNVRKLPYISRFYRNLSRKLKAFDISTVPKINYGVSHPRHSLNIHFFLPNDTKLNIRSNIIEEVNSNLNNNTHISREDRLFAKKLGLIKKYSKDNKIMFTMADKGAFTVAIEKIDYENEMLLLLSDKKNYEEITENPLEDLQLTTKNFFAKLE